MEQNGSDIVISTSGIMLLTQINFFLNPVAKGTCFRFSVWYVGHSYVTTSSVWSEMLLRWPKLECSQESSCVNQFSDLISWVVNLTHIILSYSFSFIPHSLLPAFQSSSFPPSQCCCFSLNEWWYSRFNPYTVDELPLLRLMFFFIRLYIINNTIR